MSEASGKCWRVVAGRCRTFFRMIDGGRDSPATERTLRACPVCREPRRVEVGRKADLVLMRCVACGMTYLDPAVSRLADDRYYDAGGRTFYLNAGKVLSDYSPVRLERELCCFRRHVSAGRVLDVGMPAADPASVENAVPGQYQTVGTDISSEPVRHAVSQGVDARCGDFLAMDPARVGTVRGRDVLGGAGAPAGPGAFLRHAASLLEPDGRCFVLVPNHRSLAVRLLGTKYRYVLLEHVNYFNAAPCERCAARRLKSSRRVPPILTLPSCGRMPQVGDVPSHRRTASPCCSRRRR